MVFIVVDLRVIVLWLHHGESDQLRYEENNDSRTER